MKLISLLCVCCWFACAVSCATIRGAVGPDGKPDTVSALAKDAPVAWAFEGGAPETLPQIRSVTGQQLNCTGPSGGPGFAGESYNDVTKRIEPTCLGGLTIDTSQVLVAEYGQPSWLSALCHELWHVRLMYLLKLVVGHNDPGFQPGGIVDQCNAMLQARAGP